jgi:subtilisin-like serine proteases
MKARKIISYVLIGIIISGFLSGNNAISISKVAYAKGEISDAQEGNYIVKAKNAKQRKNIIAEYKAEKSVCDIISTNTIEMSLDSSEAAELEKDYEDVLVEKNYQVKGFKSSEKKYSDRSVDEWNKKLINSIDVMDGTSGQSEDIKESYKTKIAIIDSGVNALSDVHVTARVNFIPDSENVSFMFEDATDHGTSVAAIIASSGVMTELEGINPYAEIYSVRVLDENNVAPISRIIEGIEWAIDNDMDIINLSLGTSYYSAIFHDSIKKAEENGILVVAAAGNDDVVEYPAAFPEALAVGGVDSEGMISDSSATGDNIELMAPGENVVSTGMYGAKYALSGTSVAAPHVTAVASIIKSIYPEMSGTGIRMLMNATAQNSSEDGTGYGIVDLESALENHDIFMESFDEDSINNDAFIIIENEAEPDVTDTAVVEARWSKDDHKVLINDAISQTSGSVSFEEWQWNIIRQGTYDADNKYGSNYGVGYDEEIEKDKEHSYLHGYKNYVANYRYLTFASKYVKNNGIDSFVSGGYMNNNTYRATNGYYTEINRVLKLINQDSRGYLDSNKERAVYILGIALHGVADTYAHRAFGLNGNKYFNINHESYTIDGVTYKGADDINLYKGRVRDAQIATNAALIRYATTSGYGTYKTYTYGEYSNYKIAYLYKKCKLTTDTYNGTISDADAQKLKAASISGNGIEDAEISGVNINGYTVTCKLPEETAYVAFPTWTYSNGQDDMQWYIGSIDTISGEKYGRFRVNVNSHNNEGGAYVTHIYAVDSDNNIIASDTSLSVNITRRTTIENAAATNVTSSGYTVSCKLPTGTVSVKMPTWTMNNNQDDLVWYNAGISGESSTLRVYTKNHNNESGSYVTHIYAYDSNGNTLAFKQLVITVP